MWPLDLPALVKLLIPCIHTHTRLLFICILCLCVMLSCFAQVSKYIELFSSFLYLSVYATRTVWFCNHNFVIASLFLLLLCMIETNMSMSLSTFSRIELKFLIHFPVCPSVICSLLPFYYSLFGTANI